ncbi:MAG: ion channel [Solirubrobacterales bacterium]
MEPSSAAERPLPGDRLRGSGYGLVLGLILVTLGFQLAAADTEWVRVVTIALQSATLLAAFHVSGVPRWIFHAAVIATGLACLSVAGVLIGSGELGQAATRSVGLLLIVVAPAAIVMGAARHFRATGGVTLTTMFAVLCIYLLLGMAYSYVFGIVGALDSAPFFTAHQSENQSHFLYFSFTTVTTTGFGDFTAGTDLGRSLTITEALVGQIYLVTVVAVIVGNMGRGSLRR